MTPTLDVSIVVPTLNEGQNLDVLIPALTQAMDDLGISGEILVIDGGSADDTVRLAESHGARVIMVPIGGYGEAIRVGLSEAAGTYVITMDADLSHQPRVVADLWAARGPHTIGIASRYVAGGSAEMGRTRWVLSRLLNIWFSAGLTLPVRDLSSGFRIYPTSATKAIRAVAGNFDILPELLVRAHSGGWNIVEIPFHYAPRHTGTSKARAVRLGRAYIRTFPRLWRLRNSIDAADYEDRAFDSRIPFQRYWHRRRHGLITGATPTAFGHALDIGCGSSRVLLDLGQAVGLDLAFHKLRYMTRHGRPLVQGSVLALPFKNEAFDTVICSEVIELVRSGESSFREIVRVHRPGGRLILGTPDYGRRSWRWIEKLYRRLAPSGFAERHIAHYAHDDLRDLIVSLGYRHIRTDYIFGSEMILSFDKAPMS